MTVMKKEQTIHTLSNNVPGNTGNVIKVFVSAGYWDKGNILNSNGYEFIVIDTPKKRDSWFFKVLRFLTFGKFFKPVYYYKVKFNKTKQ